MQIVRAKYENDIFYGELHENKVTRYDGSPFVIWENTEEVYDLDEIELLAPVLPSKVVAIAKNYAKHAAEMGLPEYSSNLPEHPVIFIKPSTSVIGSGQKIKYYPPEQNPNSNLAIVKTELTSSSSAQLPILYRMHQKNEEWKVVDVAVDGVSLVTTYRGSFATQIKKNGFDSLLSELSKKNARLEASISN